jgi:hypothetical protein
MTPIAFRSAIVTRRHDGKLVIAVLDGLPPPLSAVDTCVGILECTPEAAPSLCADVARPLRGPPHF